METTTPEIHPGIPMGVLLERLPGAQRALFRLYHIGGCSSCGFRAEETVAEVCERNGNLPAEEVLARVVEEAKKEEALLVDPVELSSELSREGAPALIDVRTSEEFEAVRIPRSRLLDQKLLQEILGTWEKATEIVLVDHLGVRALDAAAYFAGHGMTNVRVLQGGIDEWSRRVDPSLPRYVLE